MGQYYDGQPKPEPITTSDSTGVFPVRSESVGSVHKALEEAVSAIYFDDSSDYKTSLMAVVRHLDPEIYALMVVDRRAAFKKLSEQNDRNEFPND